MFRIIFLIIMVLNFVDRVSELAFFDERYKHRGFEFFVVYGRRRVGKTELIKSFLRGKPHIYLLCDKGGTNRNVSRFKGKIAEYFGEPVIESGDFEEVFSYLIKRLKGEKIVVVFDEFSYLIEKDDAVPSLFQVVCDEVLRNENIFLVLCGSSVSMMENGVLSKKSPLYGRKTAHIKLGELSFNYFNDFFPSNSLDKSIEFFAVLGGIPFYLQKFSDKKTTFENIKEQILSKQGKLYEEVDFLLREELREPDVYKTILDAIASGKTKVVDIANASKINVQDIDKYLKVLIRLGFIKKEIPVTKVKSKKSIYLIDDNFFSFYFLFLQPFKSDLEIGETKNIESRIKNNFHAFVGAKFEKLVQQEILRKTNTIQIQKAGKWWGFYRDKETNKRKSIEIDIVALNEEKKEILFAECKWQSKVNAEKIVSDMAEKAKYVEWHNNKRKESFAVFAKSFKKKISKWQAKKVHCFDSKDLEKILKK